MRRIEYRGGKILGRLTAARYFFQLLRRGLVLICAAAIGISCRSGNGSSGGPRLVYWSSNNQDEINLAREIVAEWNRLHPGIPVVHQPVPESESSEEVILAAVVGKTTPDIYSNMWPGDVASYVRADQLVRFDDFADFDSIAADRFTGAFIEEARSRDGHIYQILWKTNPIMLLYNKKMFRSVGFEQPPKTYAEYLEAGHRMSKDVNGDGYVDQWVGITDIRARWRDRLFDFYPLYIAATGGRTLMEDGEIAFENEKAVGVFRFFRAIYANNYFPKEITTARRDFFLLEQAASRIVGPWEIIHTEKFKPEGFEYDFSSVPVPEGVEAPIYTYGDMKSIVVFKNSRYPQEAWNFVAFMISRTNDLKLLETATQLPVRKNILDDPVFQDYFRKNPKMLAFARQATYIRGVDSNPALKEVFDALSQEFEACVVYGAKSPEEAVRDAVSRARLVKE
jgi:multiple sugar transport system substrate-binding protein